MTQLKEGEKKVLDLELINSLRTPTFLKTKLDVVYSSINNWDSDDLLYYRNNDKKGSQKSLSYIEYIWIKIVEELKRYNFNDHEIKTYRKDLLTPLVSEKFQTWIKELVKENIEISPELKATFLREDLTEVLKEIGFTTLELTIVEGIVQRQETNLLFFKDPIESIGLSHNALLSLQKNNSLLEFNNYLRKTHLNMCLTPILNKFISGDKIDPSKNMILSQEEYKMITEIRKRIKDIKTLTVKYKEGKIDRIDIHSMKSIKAESSLMAIIKSASYSSIEMTTEKGKIVCINHTEKIKI